MIIYDIAFLKNNQLTFIIFILLSVIILVKNVKLIKKYLEY